MKTNRLAVLAFGVALVAGCWSTHLAIPGGNPRGLSAGDLDGDGKLEIIVGHRAVPDGTGTLSGVSIFSNRSSTAWTFDERLIPSLSFFPDQTLPIDLDNNGKLDLVISYRNQEGGGGVQILLNEPGGFKPVGELEGAGSPLGIAAGDIDGDGDQDLIVSNTRPDAPLQIHEGSGDGTFPRVREYFSLAPSSEIVVGELGGQGENKPEIIVGGSDGFVDVLPNDGTGTFLAPLRREVGRGSVSLALADIDKNGTIEIIAASKGSRTVTVLEISDWLVRADSSLKTYPIDATPADMAVGDVNSDGELDVVLVDSEANTLHTLMGWKGGKLLPGKPVEVGKRPTEVILAAVVTRGLLAITANDRSSSITLVSLQ